MYTKSYVQFKNRAIALRHEGKTYGDIRTILGVKIPKSTLSTWLSQTSLTDIEKKKMETRRRIKIHDGRMKALAVMRLQKAKKLQEMQNRYVHLKKLLEDGDIAKISLALLYWCEGTKDNRGSCCFSNSDGNIIRLFLELMRRCYEIDETKFRGTVQCRADQNAKELTLYWSDITGISLKQFYSPQIDRRTAGKPTQKLDYKGVCRIDYFSAAIYNDLKVIASLL